MKSFQEHLSSYLDRTRRHLEQMQKAPLEQVAAEIIRAYREDRTVYVVGNGGSASTASHMSCDLSKNTISPSQRRLRVVSLTDNMAWFSAIANDVGYDAVFVEQLRTILRAGDLLVAISASGNSANVVAAVEFARELGATTIALVGFRGGSLKEAADIVVHIEGDDYGTIEDSQLVINHLLVEYLRDYIHSQRAP